ncbi:phycocyanin alpha phycocyanobilin lyase related protein NblB [Calothrix parasitica NIES-267]|uniref:Phycocyanin alpha phycocyanobilin lyase related protein NblB n=1 Tax=Calothrix parasitica NIES-267 TaxID=1973488 RepID=A0A1Z4M013_9CYAN|nr:phycocyanin alpha phycocyanobilin lyase related protein NblB [Calothrix parasitica NIES-267]
MSITPDTVKKKLESEDLGDRLRGVNEIRELEPAVGFELIQSAITDTNARVRYSAVSQFDTLGTQDLDKSLSLLRGLLQDPEADVKAAAADCLGGLKLVAAFDDLQQLYQSTEDWIIKLSVIAALGELGEPRGFELLKQALSEDNDLVKTAAISSMGELGNPEAVSILTPYSKDSDWQIRFRVAQALNRLGTPEAKPVLESLVNDEVEAVAEEAKKNLS